MTYIKKHQGNPDILFFIIIFLLLFYDNRFLDSGCGCNVQGDSSILFFILIFLILFY